MKSLIHRLLIKVEWELSINLALQVLQTSVTCRDINRYVVYGKLFPTKRISVAVDLVEGFSANVKFYAKNGDEIHRSRREVIDRFRKCLKKSACF